MTSRLVEAGSRPDYIKIDEVDLDGRSSTQTLFIDAGTLDNWPVDETTGAIPVRQFGGIFLSGSASGNDQIVTVDFKDDEEDRFRELTSVTISTSGGDTRILGAGPSAVDISGAGLLRIQWDDQDSGGGSLSLFGSIIEQPGSILTRDERAKAYAGDQAIGVGSTGANAINPESNGVTAGSTIDIVVQNNSDVAAWVNGGAASATGVKVAKDKSIRYSAHTSVDGDLSVYIPSSGSGNIDVSFYEQGG